MDRLGGGGGGGGVCVCVCVCVGGGGGGGGGSDHYALGDLNSFCRNRNSLIIVDKLEYNLLYNDAESWFNF